MCRRDCYSVGGGEGGGGSGSSADAANRNRLLSLLWLGMVAMRWVTSVTR